jgi:hypothetical protein
MTLSIDIRVGMVGGKPGANSGAARASRFYTEYEKSGVRKYQIGRTTDAATAASSAAAAATAGVRRSRRGES